MTALIAFIIAGLAVFADLAWWRPISIAVAGLSLLVILSFCLLGTHWPPSGLVR